MTVATPRSVRLAVGVVVAVSGLLPADGTRSVAASAPTVLVYAGTPGGVTAAVAAARGGAQVTLIEPSQHVGGMMINGLSWTDRGDPRVIGGLADEFFDRVQAAEGSAYGRFAFQPFTAELVFATMLVGSGVTVVLGERLAEGPGAVTKAGSIITAIRMESGNTHSADVFIDASYTGDLLAAAGVTYRVGREGREEYGESLAGVRPAVVALEAAPPNTADAIPLSGPPGPVGSGDERIQGSNYRLCLTDDPTNRVPFASPVGYDPARYDLVAARLAQQPPSDDIGELLHLVLHKDRLTAGKWDLNEYNVVSFGLPGGNYGYPDGSYAERDAIAAYHRDYQAGFLYFLANDARVPETLRTYMAGFGLCADEFTDNGNWPRQLYVREARRMTGELVLTQFDATDLRSKPDIVGIASFELDSHDVSRWVDGAGRLLVEGGFWSHDHQRWALPYRALLPLRSEVTNLLVPVAASATHVAYSSLRMEPQYMILGHAAGVAAVMAATDAIPVQDVDVPLLQAVLEASGAVLDDPGDIGDSIFYHDIVWAYYAGVTRGCSSEGEFCPEDVLTREQMASLLVRALGIAPSRVDAFDDDEASQHEADINALATHGITFGCGERRFCPGAAVPREQMASFLARAFALAPATEDLFTDDQASAHQDDINRIAAAGITSGCGGGRFCPSQPVSRGQVLAFLHRAME